MGDPFQTISSFKEFWPYYVREHSNAANRKFHFVGTGLVIVLFFLAFLQGLWILALLPVVGYGFAWAGHLAFEKNRPAALKYPFWSLFADFKMFAMMVSGKMAGEVIKYGKKAT